MARDLRAEYRAKLVTIDDVLGMIRSGQVLRAGGNACRPVCLYQNLHKLAGKVENVMVFPTAAFFGDYPFVTDPAMAGSITIASTFHDDLARAGQKLGLASYVPNHLHNGTTKTLEAYGFDKYFVTVSAMDDNGYFRFSLDNISELEYIRYAKEHGRQVIVEVNPNMPLTFGETELPIDWVDYIVEVDQPLLSIPDIPLSGDEKAIGQHVADLVEDGSTIQLGFGGIPNAVAAFLNTKNDLGVHSEMITSNMAELAKAGVITGRRKTLHWGKMVGNFSLGTPALYQFLHNNPTVMILRGAYVNDPHIIAQNYRMVAITAAIQVDLTGQICSESIGTMQYSGTGGATDFAVGASHSEGGKSIVALKSTAKKGTISPIQPVLSPGAVVSIGRNDIDYVVTEYGAAKLRGCRIQERVEHLLAVCHPKFRDELRGQAKALGIVW